MIEFRQLVEAIHSSIHRAAKSVEEDGARRINKFFYKVDESGDEIKNTDKNFDDFDFDASYRPKTVTMEFPSRTATEVKTIPVEVPLIVLSPITTPKVTEARFSADIEVTTDKEGKLLVSFPDNTKSGGWFGKKSSRGNTRLELVVQGSESPDGLKKVIEGYERALRAQIPG